MLKSPQNHQQRLLSPAAAANYEGFEKIPELNKDLLKKILAHDDQKKPSVYLEKLIRCRDSPEIHHQRYPCPPAVQVVCQESLCRRKL